MKTCLQHGSKLLGILLKRELAKGESQEIIFWTHNCSAQKIEKVLDAIHCLVMFAHQQPCNLYSCILVFLYSCILVFLYS